MVFYFRVHTHLLFNGEMGMNKIRHRRSTLTIQQTISESFQGRMANLDAAAKRAAIKQINPLFYVFGYKLEAPKDYLKDQNESHY
jgi:hypothetical protein